MLEKQKTGLDKCENDCTIFMDFATINHDLLLAKLNAYGFSENAIKMMCSYLKDRQQTV